MLSNNGSQQMDNLISIVCTVYNEEKLIAKTLESFLSQELNGMESEILIVDGMSEDNTREIVKSYNVKYPRIKLLDNPERKNPFEIVKIPLFDLILKEKIPMAAIKV